MKTCNPFWLHTKLSDALAMLVMAAVLFVLIMTAGCSTDTQTIYEPCPVTVVDTGPVGVCMFCEYGDNDTISAVGSQVISSDSCASLRAWYSSDWYFRWIPFPIVRGEL